MLCVSQRMDAQDHDEHQFWYRQYCRTNEPVVDIAPYYPVVHSSTLYLVLGHRLKCIYSSKQTTTIARGHKSAEPSRKTEKITHQVQVWMYCMETTNIANRKVERGQGARSVDYHISSSQVCPLFSAGNMMYNSSSSSINQQVSCDKTETTVPP